MVYNGMSDVVYAKTTLPTCSTETQAEKSINVYVDFLPEFLINA